MSKQINTDYDFWKKRKKSSNGDKKSIMCKKMIVSYLIYCKNIDSILDIGCNYPVWIMKLIKDIDYTGIDISDKVIMENIKNYQNRRFINMDISKDSMENIDKSDLVLLISVLIHTISKEDYMKVIITAIDKAKKYVVVNGYNNVQKSQKEMVYHENLENTLKTLKKEIGGFSYIKLMDSGKQTFYLITKRGQTI